MRISERENSSGAEEGRDKNTHPKNKNLGGEKKKMNKITNKKTFALLLSVVLVISAMSAVMPAMATEQSYPLEPDDPVITSALDYLQSVQSDDGNIGGFGTSAWVVMGIAAAGEDPHAWKTAPGNPSVVDYLKDNPQELEYEWNIATGYERMILAIVAACEDPSAFGAGDDTYVPDGDYVAKLKELHNGAQFVDQWGTTNTLNDDFWGILALIAAGEDPDSEMIQNTTGYIKANQGADGGWSWATIDNPWYWSSDVDDTAAAIMALIAAGESPSSACITNATNYLHVNQDAMTGGFASWGVVNAASTSWAIDAIVSVGQDPTSANWTKMGIHNPVDSLLTLQSVEGAPAGSFVYADPLPPYYLPMYEKMTADAIVALLGKPYPVLCVVPATVRIEPETLNLASNGEWVTAYIELPEGYNVTDIDVNTVCLGTVPAENDTQYDFVTDPDSYLMDHDGDGIMERMVKFDRAAVIAYFDEIGYAGDTGKHKLVELSVTGEVAGTSFEGSDTIKVIV